MRPPRSFIHVTNFKLLRNVYDTPGLISIPSEVKKDIDWWYWFLPLYNGISIMAVEEWSKPDSEVSSDACLSGCGSWSNGEFFHREFPEFISALDLHINALELLSVVVCLKVWSNKLHHKRIKVFCDNIVSVQVINTGKTRDIFMQSCLRELCFIAAVNEFEVRAVHVRSCDNRIPDFLSRWHLHDKFKVQFYNAAKKYDKICLREIKVEDSTFSFSHDW